MEFNLEVRAQDGKVYTNAKQLLPAIREGLKAYEYVVDENNYKQAKSDRASLNKLIKMMSLLSGSKTKKTSCQLKKKFKPKQML